MNIAAELDREIQHWTEERDQLDAMIAAATELVHAIGGTEPAEVEVEPDPSPTTKPTKRARGASEKVACPDCGKLYHKQGMGVHRSRAHPDSAAKPVAPIGNPAKRDPHDTFGDEFFVCSSCDHEEPNPAGIMRHTMADHGRRATDNERTAVAA